jgi:hypothetical protein
VLRVARLVTVGVLVPLLYAALLLPGIVAVALLAVALLAVVQVEKRWPARSSRGFGSAVVTPG